MSTLFNSNYGLPQRSGDRSNLRSFVDLCGSHVEQGFWSVKLLFDGQAEMIN
jgi:hypothetical protein